MMKNSPLIEKILADIAGVKNQTLSIEERIEKAIALAADILNETNRIQTRKEKKLEEKLAGMMNDPIGKVFTTVLTDQCFRSRRPSRVADQIVYTIEKYGVPTYLPIHEKLALRVFPYIGKLFAGITVPLTIGLLRQETSSVIIPGEPKELKRHIETRRLENVRLNINHLGEAILSEEEALQRINLYLEDLANPLIEYVSIKISTIYSQINLLAWDETLEMLKNRLRLLYRAAMKYSYTRPDGMSVPKFVNLDMEEYRDLHLTVALFQSVLDEPEFYQYSAGIVLQSYLPDSFSIQRSITEWAMQRTEKGGSPVKIRIVKGANMAMEQVDASLHLWPQAPYNIKADTDANYKRMVNFGCEPIHAKSVHLGIASHNLFDITYALLLRSENDVEKEVCFEMLEGMADHIRRVVQDVAGDMLLYCPAATKNEFQHAVAYLVRRLDENTAPQNFLRNIFDLVPGSDTWNTQADLFANSCRNSSTVSCGPKRVQNRLTEVPKENNWDAPFTNEPDTDWSLLENLKWSEEIFKEWSHKSIPPIPLVIAGNEVSPTENLAENEDPSNPGKVLYHYSLASIDQVNEALECAKNAEKSWSQTTIRERSELLAKISNGLRKNRGHLLGAMIADGGKMIQEADVEFSEAIDFAEYYRTSIQQLHHLDDIEWRSKGTVLVTPPWNFPCSIPAGGVLGALAAGNCVIFKPAPESVLVGWELARIFWEAGVSKNVLQFITCEDDPVGTYLIKDPRISTVILTGATSTAKLFLKMRPGLDLMGETGGKNAMIITAMADRDLAVKDLLQSAFGHSGQKCSACSLAILEVEIYDDLHFKTSLRNAAASLAVGTQWNPKTKVNPMIREPHPDLLKGLTTLEEGEEWLLEPKQNAKNPRIWSPGIKLGVKPGSFTFQTELFGPVLGVVRADNLAHAVKIANQTPYGLTSGIHSLDDREHAFWLDKIVAGNCYINRTTTGAIVDRQPFGGCKDSSFGRGAKAGGPNYLTQLMNPRQVGLPLERDSESGLAASLTEIIKINRFSSEEREIWQASVGSAAFYWNHYFSKAHDPCLVIGQDNLFKYTPHVQIALRVQSGDSLFDVLRVIAAASTCSAPLEVSNDDESIHQFLEEHGLLHRIFYNKENEESFLLRVKKGEVARIRLLQDPSDDLQQAMAESACRINLAPVLANGRLELLHYLREISISHDYHRYGNLGDRENEKRALLPHQISKENNCANCRCHE